MLTLRVQGKGPSELGRLFGVDHTTIIYHCRRNGVGAKVASVAVISVAEVKLNAIKNSRITITNKGVTVTDFDGEPICGGRSYSDYVREAAKRKEQQFWARVLASTIGGTLMSTSTFA